MDRLSKHPNDNWKYKCIFYVSVIFIMKQFYKSNAKILNGIKKRN